MEHFFQIQRELVLENPWYSIYLDKVAVASTDETMDYYVQKFANDSVAAVITNKKGEILFVEAYRYVTDEISLEIPAGGVDDHESLSDAAKRECLEETGYAVDLQDKFHSYYPSNGVTDQMVHLFFGQLDERIRQTAFHENEIAKIKWLDMETVKEKIKNSEITDGLTLTAILFMLCDN